MDVFANRPNLMLASRLRFGAERRAKPSERRRTHSLAEQPQDVFISSGALRSRANRHSREEASSFDVQGLSKALSETTQFVPPTDREWFDAVNQGDASRLRHWLHAGENPDREDAHHETALFKAIRQRDSALIQPLLRYKANLLHPDETGRTPMHVLASEGDAELLTVIKPFIRDKDRVHFLNVEDDEGVTPFMLVKQSLLASHFKVMGVNIHAVDRQGRAGIHHAAQSGNTEMLSRYKVWGVDLNSPDASEGATPLHYAIFAKQDKVLRWLLNEAEVDINRCDMKGQTPLGYALLLNRDEAILNRLIEHRRLNQTSLLEGLSLAAYFHNVPLTRRLLKKVQNFPRAIETVNLKNDDVNRRHMALETLLQAARQEKHRQLPLLRSLYQDVTQERLAFAACLGDLDLSEALFKQVDNFPRVIQMIHDEVPFQSRRNTAFNTLLRVAKRQNNRNAQVLLRDIGKRPTSDTLLSGYQESARRFSTGEPFNNPKNA